MKIKHIIDFQLKCSKCNEIKPLSEYYPDKWKVSGYASQCKSCDRNRRKTRYETLPDNHSTIINGKRTCNICKTEKFLAEFGKDKEEEFGRSRKCLVCKVKKESRRQSEYLYGITFEEKQKILAEQLGLCANRACGKEIKFDTVIRAEMAVLDHCHTTGKKRGLLCNRCNLLLGAVERKNNLKSKYMLLGLTEYIQKHT